MRGHRDPNMGDLEIRGFTIRGIPFPPISANCKDFLYLLTLVFCKPVSDECKSTNAQTFHVSQPKIRILAFKFVEKFD